MNSKDFEQVIKDTQARTTDLLLRKGQEYASNNDRLSNFKENAKKLGLTPIQVWAVYAFKHMDSIETYIRRTHQHAILQDRTIPEAMADIDATLSEPIIGRFDDAINYMHLGIAILKEMKEGLK